jgi:hypothetical protein
MGGSSSSYWSFLSSSLIAVRFLWFLPLLLLRDDDDDNVWFSRIFF